MKILVASFRYWPEVGGLQRVTELMCRHFQDQGHMVRILTTSDGPGSDSHRLDIVRSPSAMELIHQVSWCEVYWHNSLQVRALWPVLFLRRPVVVTHTRVYEYGPGMSELNPRGKMKHLLRRKLGGMAVSRVVAESIDYRMRVVGNPYDDKVFKLNAEGERSGLCYVGRLTSEKGVDLLIQAIAQLQKEGFAEKLRIIGCGEEEPALRALVLKLGLKTRIDFLGLMEGKELADELNRSRVFVMSTIVIEGFGVAALEAAACGCLCVVPANSGAEEAAGPAALTYQRGDLIELVQAIRKAFKDPRLAKRPMKGMSDHLQRFEVAAIGNEYLMEFQRLIT